MHPSEDHLNHRILADIEAGSLELDEELPVIGKDHRNSHVETVKLLCNMKDLVVVDRFVSDILSEAICEHPGILNNALIQSVFEEIVVELRNLPSFLWASCKVLFDLVQFL